MIALEVGLKLDNHQKDYEKILEEHNAINRWDCETHDIYWTDKDLNGLTENEMKRACVRLRMTRGIGGKDFKTINKIKNALGIKGNWNCRFQNYKVFDKTAEDQFEVNANDLEDYHKKFDEKGYKKVFDTYKTDYQYSIGNMKSRIQLQDIKDIGLLLYYDNPELYELPLEEQRKKLIEELNSYGFDFKKDELGIDKLRTLYYGKDCYSENQNG